MHVSIRDSSSNLQAACYYATPDECLVRISSGLVNLLDDTEFRFVIAHELGHFLLQHSAVGISQNSVEYFVFQRAQEISADRVGVIGCRDENAAARALIKTASGLESRHIHLDIGQFLSQLSKIGEHSRGEDVGSTHPSMLVRTRALIWFAMSDAQSRYPNVSRTALDRVDQKVSSDMNKHVDGQALDRIKQAKADVAMWLAAAEIAADGRFDASEQDSFKDVFGSLLLKKLKDFFEGVNSTSLNDAILGKLTESKARLEQLAPSDYSSNYEDIRNRVLLRFSRN